MWVFHRLLSWVSFDSFQCRKWIFHTCRCDWRVAKNDKRCLIVVNLLLSQKSSTCKTPASFSSIDNFWHHNLCYAFTTDSETRSSKYGERWCKLSTFFNAASISLIRFLHSRLEIFLTNSELTYQGKE